jgi:hypothetical protein
VFIKKQGDTQGVKDFISVLMLYKDHDAKAIETAIEKALYANTGTFDAVKHILLNGHGQITRFGSLENWETLPPPDVSVYHQIGGVV